MVGNCTNPECPAPISCHEGNEVSTCEFWTESKKSKTTNTLKKATESVKSNISWTGEALLPQQLETVGQRNRLIVIGIVGKANAGKTSFLAMIYTLLYHGHNLSEYDFSGSKTLVGWDKLHHKLKVIKSKVAYPDPTLPLYLRLLHLALRAKNQKLTDVVISDASGEVFSTWSQKRLDPLAENARWVHDNSNAFIFFIDCEDLATRKNLAKTEVIDIAQMLSNELKGRPVICVWSKADLKDTIHTVVQESLKKELETIFSDYVELNVSNLSIDDPDELVHVNNIKVIDLLLTKVFSDGLLIDTVNVSDPNDYFLNYQANG